MLLLADRFTLWLGWIVLASLFFSAVPVGPFGLAGWIGAMGPLLHRIFPNIGLRRMAISGLVAIGLVLFASGIETWLDLALPPAVYLFGLLLAPVPIAGLTGAQRNATPTSDDAFQLALAREVGRARRYERPLTLISAACEGAGDLATLDEVIASQVHVYAQQFRLGDRILVIVPELDATSYPALEQRLLESARSHHLKAIELGSASFPQGECTASGLVEMAEATCRHHDLRPYADAPRNRRAADDLSLPQS